MRRRNVQTSKMYETYMKKWGQPMSFYVYFNVTIRANVGLFIRNYVKKSGMKESVGSLWELGSNGIRELETERGIMASGKSEAYGCIFGRDSLITVLELMALHRKGTKENHLPLVRKVLGNLAELQGTEMVLESGEEPGKCIHEFRPTGHEHLTRALENPWYVYPDNVMRNYDTVDATPLYLWAFDAYLRESRDVAFVEEHIPSIRAALLWVLDFGDSNNDGFIDYRFHPDRMHGGLKTQSWMDSAESVFFEKPLVDASGSVSLPEYPIAPVEVQAYTYVALRAWSSFFSSRDPEFSARLFSRAADLKRLFNVTFVMRQDAKRSLAYAIDGRGRLLSSPRSSMGHVLWAVWRDEITGKPESILADEHIPAIVARVLARDLFVPKAGVRTLSSRSSHFDAGSYHNGSIWPHDTAILAEGLDNFGYTKESLLVREALMSAYGHFKTPIELFVFTKGRFKEYKGPSGQGACRMQAWSAASLLSTIQAMNPQSIE